jgi:hypothetical protein
MRKRKISLSLISLLFYCFAIGQVAEKVIVYNQDPYNLYNFEPTDKFSLFYLKLVPKAQPIGCLVIIPGSGELIEDVMKQISLHNLAVEKGLLVIFPSINWGTNKFIEEHKFLDTIFKQVIQQYNIPKEKVILGGFSNGGMVSLTYAEKANRDEASTYIVPKAIFALDPPLDFVHLYNHAKHDVERNFSVAAVNEGHWLMNMFKTEFGGTPDEVPNEYIRYSIYSNSEKDGGNAKYLLNTPIRIYTEPDIDWQMKNRHRDFYDMNCTDISAMINLLHLNGNVSAEMIVTYNKGFRLDGTKHPHSWSIMDSSDCLTWILKQLN